MRVSKVINIIGNCIFYLSLITSTILWIICTTSAIQSYFLILKAVFVGLELLGIALNISSYFIKKCEE